MKLKNGKGKYAIVVLVTSSSKGERLKQALDCGVEAVQVGEDYNLIWAGSNSFWQFKLWGGVC